MKQLVIAIDGPAGAGKSTVAKAVAQILGYVYIDTGSMYRAIAWQALSKQVQPDDAEALTAVARTIKIELKNGSLGLRVFANNQDITAAIRTPQVTALVATVAEIPGVRLALLGLQRQLASTGGVVMDGRDIGTKILPTADVKIFLTATVEKRARRRHKEFLAKGYNINFAKLQQEIADRDKQDSERACSPLVQASDAVLLDTSDLTVEQAVQSILTICQQKG
jgi:cytidylate kinase